MITSILFLLFATELDIQFVTKKMENCYSNHILFSLTRNEIKISVYIEISILNHVRPNLDCNYNSRIDLTPNEISFWNK